MSKDLGIPLILMTISLGACSDQTSGPITGPDGILSLAGYEEGELPSTPLYEIEIEVEGALEANVPITVHARITARHSEDNTHIRIASPDAEASKASGWKRFEPSEGAAVPAVLDQRVSLGRNETSSHDATLVFAAPGYYRVVVTAQGTGAASQHSEFVQEVVNKEVWLWIDSLGGEVTSSFDSKRFAPNIYPTPGPFRKAPDSSSRSLAPSSSGTYALFKVQYYHSPAPAGWFPVGKARIRLRIFDEYEARFVSDGGAGYTDANGFFTAGCPSGFDTYYYDIYPDNSDVRVGSSAANITSTVVYQNDPACTDGATTTTLNATADRSHVFRNMNSIIPLSRAYLARSRGLVTINFTTASGSTYNNDAISLSTSSIYGPKGYDVQAHEYGHAVHHRALGAFSQTIPQSCVIHAIDDAEILLCAFQEGFADYHAVVVGSTRFNFESVDYSLGCIARNTSGICTTYQPARDGSVVEGAVASMFLDITDGSNEAPHDELTLPGSYIASVIVSCEVYISGWRRVNGIDELIACFQNQLPTYSQHFPTRNPDATNYREFVSEPGGWTAIRILKNWRKNLYNETI